MTAGGGAAAFASVDDLEGAWRSLSTQEKVWAAELLDAAARWIDRNVPDVSSRLADAKVVSISVVKSALSAGAATGYLSHSKGIGPWSKSGTLVNPDGALTFTDWHKQQLGISTVKAPRYYFGDCDV